jgi:GTP-binding protein Era
MTLPKIKKQPAPAPAPQPPKVRTGFVALVGRPNVGKSTLLNKVLGEKVAIVSDKPQTTRVSILGIKTTDKGQILFLDNPGIHKPLHKLNKRMMSFVYASLETADVICLLIDASLPFGHGDEFVIEALKKVDRPLILLINKVDIVRKDRVLPLIDKYKDLLPFKEIIPISAVDGTNLDVLENAIYGFLPEREKTYGDDELTTLPERFYMAELIREKLLKHVRMELPFVTAVYIDAVEHREEKAPAGAGAGGREVSPESEAEKREHAAERSSGRGLPKKRRPVVYIKASIFVERDNHRKIIIGRQGEVIKTIGIEARRELENYLEAKLYLDLQVRVRPEWRDSPDVLDLIEGQR